MDGDADLNNPDFLFAGQVVAYTSSLPSNLRDVMSNNFWLFYDIKEFFKNNGGLTQTNKDAVVFTLSNIEAIFTTISQNSNDLTTVQINQTKQSAFQFLLQHGAWLAGQSATTQQSIKNYLIANNFSDESEEFIGEVKNLSIDLDINAMEIWDNQYDDFRNGMSVTERVIFDNLFITRRLSYMVAAKKAYDKAIELYPNSFYNGKGDAYRHTLWNALTSLLIGSDLANQLTTAHEEKPFVYQYNYKEKDMDLYNNQKGRNIATFSNLSTVFENVQTALNVGSLMYLNNLETNSNLATQNSSLTPTNQ